MILTKILFSGESAPGERRLDDQSATLRGGPLGLVHLRFRRSSWCCARPLSGKGAATIRAQLLRTSSWSREQSVHGLFGSGRFDHQGASIIRTFRCSGRLDEQGATSRAGVAADYQNPARGAPALIWGAAPKSSNLLKGREALLSLQSHKGRSQRKNSACGFGVPQESNRVVPGDLLKTLPPQFAQGGLFSLKRYQGAVG
jgi:hypothetical protein